MEQNSTKHLPEGRQEDITISGALIISGIFTLIVFVVYLFSIQKKAQNCLESVRPDGTIVTVCKPENLDATNSGQIEYLDNLKPKGDEVDKTLRQQLQP